MNAFLQKVSVASSSSKANEKEEKEKQKECKIQKWKFDESFFVDLVCTILGSQKMSRI